MKFPEFSQNLKKARIISGKTQHEVAVLLGILDNAYQKYEGGDREPNLSRLRELSDILNVSADFLLGLTENPVKPEK